MVAVARCRVRCLCARRCSRSGWCHPVPCPRRDWRAGWQGPAALDGNGVPCARARPLFFRPDDGPHAAQLPCNGALRGWIVAVPPPHNEPTSGALSAHQCWRYRGACERGRAGGWRLWTMIQRVRWVQMVSGWCEELAGVGAARWAAATPDSSHRPALYRSGNA